jgi:RNA-binding protein
MTELPDEDRDAASPTLADPSAPPPVLSSSERRTLRARAHDLDPVVMIGDAGLTDAVLAEADRALARHGLIKVRVFGDDRDARLRMADVLSQRLGCALVQAIGKLLVLWRPGAEPAEPSRTPIRRREAAAPKKLAALGKPAPTRRARPPRPDPDEPAPRRRLASKQLRAGPGIRSAKGALDPTVMPRTRGGAPAGTVTERAPRPTTSRTGARGSSTPARGQVGRKPGAPSPRTPGAPAARKPGAPAARKPGAPSAARPPASGSRQGARSATSSSDSGRPAPRTRAVRRGR